MNSQDFLTINMVGVGAFVLWYALSRGGGKRPTRLDMKAPDSVPPLLDADPSEIESDNSENSANIPVLRSEAMLENKSSRVHSLHPDRASTKTKSLNVIFNYNGHSWDAYEVLGVPAGASIPTVTEAYQTALRRCDKTSVEFLETAYKAILNKGN
ncbi:MAG TPA: hypothetical protein VN132_05940 [Bdellovibrio sp.]|nr:hypothetical protein [Bdellovibrio sp.]